MGNRHVRRAKAEAAQYVLKRGIGGVSASNVGEALAHIYERDGALEAQAVVDAARPVHSSLHGAFEWDDALAGEQFRLGQARQLIRNIRVVRGDEKTGAPVYVHVTGEAYHTVEAVVQRADWFASAYHELAARIKAAQRAADDLRGAAEGAEEHDSDRLARIAMVIQAMEVASAAVMALH